MTATIIILCIHRAADISAVSLMFDSIYSCCYVSGTAYCHSHNSYVLQTHSVAITYEQSDRYKTNETSTT